jgi:S1-C subfamily serine protease
MVFMLLRYLSVGVLLLAVSGCAYTFSYDGINYANSVQAKLAALTDVQRKVGAVDAFPERDRIGGVATIFIPDNKTIRAKGVINVGAGQSPEVITQYIVDISELGVQGNADAIVRSQLFDEVNVVRTSELASPSAPAGQYTIWTDIISNRWEWYTKGINGEKRTIAWNMSASPLEIMNGFNMGVRLALSGNKASTVRKPRVKNRTGAFQTKIASTGTGFWINRGGIALTNQHVVEGCESLQTTISGNTYVLSTVAVDEKLDLALVKAKFSPQHYAKFRSGKGIRTGDDIVVFGFPLHNLLAEKGNVTTGTVSALAGLGNDTSRLQLSAPIQPGNSGGPVLDSSGNVVGIVVSRLNALKMAEVTGTVPQNINFAIKASAARAFIESSELKYEARRSESVRSNADTAEEASAVSFLVECHN